MKKKLRLNRETLRHLSGSNLQNVVGGSGSGLGCDSINQCGGSYTYCDEHFCNSGDPRCANSDAISWCICEI